MNSIKVSIGSTGFICLMIILPCQASPDDSTWGVTPIFGAHTPPLSDLNNGEFLSPLIMQAGDGQSDTSNNQGQPRQPFAYNNPLPATGAGSEVGAEFLWRMNGKNRFIFGLSVWEVGSRATNSGEWKIAGQLHTVDNEREAKLSYTQFYVGWRRNLFRSVKKFNLYSTFSLHEIFDIDYQEKYVFDILAQVDPTLPQSNLPGNTRIIIFKSQATGGLNISAGLGGEYFMTPWFSIGLQASYYENIGKIFLKDYRIDHNLQAGDDFDLALTDFDGPISLPENGQLSPLNFAVNESERRPLYLDLGGWRALLRLNFYF